MHCWRPAQWLDGKEAPKHFPKSNLHQKMPWSLLGGLLPIWSTTAFWIPVKLSHLRSMLSKLMRCTKSCNTCIERWSRERARFFSMKHPTTHHTTNTSKVERIGLQSFASSTIFTWPLTNRLLLLQSSQQLFAGKMLPHPAGGRKCFPRICQILKHGFLCYRNKLISYWQKHVDRNGSYFD